MSQLWLCSPGAAPDMGSKGCIRGTCCCGHMSMHLVLVPWCIQHTLHTQPQAVTATASAQPACTLCQLDPPAHHCCLHCFCLSLPRHPVLLCTTAWQWHMPDLMQIVQQQIAVPDANGQCELICMQGRQYSLTDNGTWLTFAGWHC